MCKFAAEQYKATGLHLHMSANPTEVVKQPDGRLTVKISGLNGREDSCITDNDQVVLAVGRGAKTKGLGLEETGVELGEWRGEGAGRKALVVGKHKQGRGGGRQLPTARRQTLGWEPGERGLGGASRGMQMPPAIPVTHVDDVCADCTVMSPCFQEAWQYLLDFV